MSTKVPSHGVALRRYQRNVLDRCQDAWSSGLKALMPVLPTGGGKSVVIAQAALEHDGDGIVMAHRSELVSQLSMALAKQGVMHNVVTSAAVRSTILRMHHESFGRIYVNANADWHVASVDTFIRRMPPKLRKPLVIMDEGHHVLRDNKWGKALYMLPDDKRVMLPTATPSRSDKLGLGAHASGVAEQLILGPSARDLIDMGMLCDYDVLTPVVSDLQLSELRINKTGDFNQHVMASVIENSRLLVGSVVEQYQKHAYGKQAVCFAASIDNANKICHGFLCAGIRAQVVTGDDTEYDRRSHLAAFRARDIQVLINVDLFGEGFDVPGIEVVIMARPTNSFGLYSQQWGRALRLDVTDDDQRVWDSLSDAERLARIGSSRKPGALIIDHVGNLVRHNGPPDRQQVWTLDSQVGQSRGNVSMYKTCDECFRPYMRYETKCPHCGHDPASDSIDTKAIKEVDGDLRFLSAEELDKMRKQVIRPTGAVYIPVAHRGKPSGERIRRERLAAQESNGRLRLLMSYWAGMYPDLSAEEKCKLFYIYFDIDALSALTLRRVDSEKLIEKIQNEMQRKGYVINNLHLADNFKVDASDWMGN